MKKLVPSSSRRKARAVPTAARRATETAKGRWPCSRAGWCHAMERALGDTLANESGRGLSVFVLMDMKTGDDAVYGIRHRPRAGDGGTLLNVCPWCAKSIDYTKRPIPVRQARATLLRGPK